MGIEDDKDLDDVQLFQEAVKGARPVKVNRVLHPQKNPNPSPKNSMKMSAKSYVIR